MKYPQYWWRKKNSDERKGECESENENRKKSQNGKLLITPTPSWWYTEMISDLRKIKSYLSEIMRELRQTKKNYLLYTKMTKWNDSASKKKLDFEKLRSKLHDNF